MINTIYIDFSYAGYAARLLTYQEVVSACGSGIPTSSGYLDNCNYSKEMDIRLYNLELKKYHAGSSAAFYDLASVRPVIEALLSKIDK